MKGMKDRGGRGDGGIGDFFLGLGPRPSRLVQSEVGKRRGVLSSNGSKLRSGSMILMSF